MTDPLILPDDTARLEVLRQYGVLDTPPEQALDDLTAMAAQICGAPIALISLVDEYRQWFKSKVGIEVNEMDRKDSICSHALDQRDVFTVTDATRDGRFADFGCVTGDPHIRFYAGAPLTTPENAALGTLCVIDRIPRTLTKAQKQALQILARQVMTHLELRRQMTDLRLSEERFSNAFEHAPIGMALVAIEGRWLKVNQALCHLLGYSAHELAQKTFQEVTHPDDLEKDLVHVRNLLTGNASSYHMEKRYFHKEGSIVWVNLGVSLVKDKNKAPLYFISQIVDISESRAAFAQQQELTRKAQAGERAKSDFLATMSHEIRTPLNGVIGMASILADTELNEMQRECVETINTSGASLLAVINDILDYSKIEAGRLEMEHRSFNLRQCVEEAFDLFASQIRTKQLEAVYFVSPEIPPNLIGDAMRLRQVLVNLIGNAIKFTGRGEISVHIELKETREEGSHLVFSVTDTGIGIPEEVIGGLFQAFQQVDTSTTRRYGGTGLGLAICKRLTGLMGGSIWVTSKHGIGSTFSFSAVLPAAPAMLADSGRQVPQAHSVLVVDDNARTRHFLELELKYLGLKVTTAPSGEEALAILGYKNFDAALIDSAMPEMDGRALARNIKARHNLPLIVLSSGGGNFGGDDDRLFQAQISKPIKHAALLHAVQKVTGDHTEIERKTPDRKLDSTLALQHPLRILLAEDNKVNQKVGLLMLSRLGYQANAVDNGRRAVEALEASTYDVILMDIQMPEMNGIEATRLIIERYSENHRPVIVALTAEALEGDEERLLSSGFDFYLSKPLQSDRLQQTLRVIGTDLAARLPEPAEK